MQRVGDRTGQGARVVPGVERGAGVAASSAVRRAPEWTCCDACGTGMQSLGHCKWICRRCGFMRTCIDTV